MPSAVAFVPARSGSQRVPGKNVRPLRGHPLIAYTIRAALDAELFGAVVVSTDSEEVAEIARHYGADVPRLRPAEIATATSPDIEWVLHAIDALAAQGRAFDAFSILRPTSPFRGAATIRRGWERLLAVESADSLRAIELCRQHPGKMWVLEGELMRPLLPEQGGTPLHSRQYQALPEVYVQNSSLEIAWTRVATEGGTIAGERVVPFFTDPSEGFSIDYPSDLERAEELLASGEAVLPEVPERPFVVELSR